LRITIIGSSVDVVPLVAAQHGDALFEGAKGHDELWRYLFDGPYHDRAAFDAATAQMAKSDDPLYYAIIDKASGRAVGRAALMRIDPAHHIIEVGSILYTPKLQRTRGATEAMYLLARYIFEDLGCVLRTAQSCCFRSALPREGAKAPNAH
jgi:RimJ/RimL family protein N-acetyltransferase